MTRRSIKGRRGFWRAGVLVGLAVAAGAGWWAWNRALVVDSKQPAVVEQPTPAEATKEALPAKADVPKVEASRPSKPPLTPAQLAAEIDGCFAASWQEHGVMPAPVATDEEFIRRAYLDVTGKIPTAGEAKEYLDDKAPDKRARLVARLLEHARFSNHLAVTLRETLLPGTDNDPMKRAFVPGFEGWLRLRLSDGVAYDQLVRELLTAKAEAADPLGPGGRRSATFGPGAFTLVHENKPELLAGSAARALLGVQVQCAECHDHPFAEWKQEQFWSFAAFFAAPAVAATGVSTQPPLELEIPTKKTKVRPRFLDGESASFSSGDPTERRRAVAEWIIKNPGFAKAAANRVWWHFTGRGLVHPVDDMGANNPPSHPAVLELLAEQFRANGYSFRYLAEAIALTRVYSLSSTTASPGEPTSFASMPVRTMTPEQLYDSLMRAAFGRSTTSDSASAEAALLTGDTQRTQFLRMFWEPVERTGARGSILQALALMNGPVLAAAVDPDKETFLRAVLTSPFLDDRARVETLYLATLTRRPTPRESGKLDAHLKASGADEAAKRKAFADVFWALLNSSEFAMTR